MWDSTNWRLVFQHLIPVVYVPIAALIGFAVLVAVTGTGGFDHIEVTAYLVTALSFVLVFARLASREIHSAKQNISALGMFCYIVFAGAGAGVVGWHPMQLLLLLALVGAALGVTATIGLLVARQWVTWRMAGGSEPQSSRRSA